MSDLYAARIRAHKNNLDRYRRLLATDLTSNEREYLHRRIAQERAELARLESPADVDALMDRAGPVHVLASR